MRWWPFRRRRRQANSTSVTDNDGLYQIVPLSVMAKQLTQCSTDRYQPTKQGQTLLQVITSCLPNLIERLDNASYSIKHDTNIEKWCQCLERLETTLPDITLDDYLLDSHRYPIDLATGISELNRSLEQYTQRFLTLQSQKPYRAGYYQKQYTYLLEETHEVLQKLSEVLT